MCLQSDGVGGFAPSLAAVDLTTERLVSEVLQSADNIAAAAAAASTGDAAGQHAYGQQLQQQDARQQQQGGSWGGGLKSSPPQTGGLGAGEGVSRILGEHV
eukprot:GHUV01039728.1.p4 GENE.GHUV01039728.1~~GHUV01039728.1.p4  ORF type:complete len:101 (-),score=49.47 GHUV01039728.1:480-782(-)